MNAKIALFLITLASMMYNPAWAAHTPVRLSVPAHTQWCVSSQPILIEDDQPGKKFGDLVFSMLYQRLEKHAIASKLASIGVPFLDAAVPVAGAAAPPGNAPATPPAATPAVKYVLTVCAVVPPDAPAPVTGVSKRHLVDKEVYAVLCAVTDESACKASIEKLLRDVHGLSDTAIAARQWRTSQPLDGSPAPDSLRRSLVDYSVRPLQHGLAVPVVPTSLMILSTAVP